MTKLSVNINKVATLRNARGGNVPDVMEEHASILRLIENGDASQIEPLLKRHLYGGVRRLGPHLYTTYASYFEPLGDEKP